MVTNEDDVINIRWTFFLNAYTVVQITGISTNSVVDESRNLTAMTLHLVWVGFSKCLFEFYVSSCRFLSFSCLFLPLYFSNSFSSVTVTHEHVKFKRQEEISFFWGERGHNNVVLFISLLLFMKFECNISTTSTESASIYIEHKISLLLLLLLLNKKFSCISLRPRSRTLVFS